MIITRFSRTLAVANGSPVSFALQIQAQCPATHYLPYPYFGINTANSRYELIGWGSSADAASAAYEGLTRDRRCVRFTDVTRLRPSRPTFFSPAEMEALRKIQHMDHVTGWTSSTGATFVLNEPYVPNADGFFRTGAYGFVIAVVPINISPYCGSWSSEIGALPYTRSYLIARGCDAAELECLQERLEAAACSEPAWNDITGIHHV
jgi:hypothetical protein